MAYTAVAHRKAKTRIFTLSELVIVFVIIAFLAGGAIAAREMVELSRVRAQIAQIDQLDAAVQSFSDKYNGLPGDLLSQKAQLSGLPYGDGSLGHSNGDGKITACDPALPFRLGCETALFWAQLSIANFITQDFSGEGRYSDSNVISTRMMQDYLPRSVLSDQSFIAVWNTNALSVSTSTTRQLPYGNYYEISRMTGIAHEKLNDDFRALTPAEARAIDTKMDDGYPLSGRVMINGNADQDGNFWGNFAKRGDDSCIAPDDTYNTYEFFKAHHPVCHVAIAMGCCDVKEEE